MVRVSLLGNCTFHADVVGDLHNDPTDPIIPLVGTFLITSADTKTTLKGKVDYRKHIDSHENDDSEGNDD